MKEKMKLAVPVILVTLFLCSPLPLPPGPGVLNHGTAFAQEKNTNVIVDVETEDREVGLKRMEILDKALTPEIVQKKNAFVRMKEQDYNRKIGGLVQRLTTPIGNNTVITHIDVDFLDPGFDKQVQATERVNVTILLDRDGFAKWTSGKPSPEAAKDLMRDLVSQTFDIPDKQISIVIAPN